MRNVKYKKGSGRVSNTATGNLNELVMLMEAAVGLANVERWVQHAVALAARERSGDSIVSDDVRDAGKLDSYEVSVVDGFMRLGAVSFAAHGSEAVWERTFKTGERGRPVSVDVCLFSAKREEEARIEFGRYTVQKLKDDSAKLGRKLPEAAELSVVNYVMLWRTRESGVVASDSGWLDKCIADAAKATTEMYEVLIKVASEQDLFVADSGHRRKVQVGLFSVQRKSG